MATPRQPDGMSPAEPSAGAPSSAAPEGRHSRWIWVSALLAIVAVGLAIWALSLRSELDDTKQELTSTKQELDTTKQQLTSTKQELGTTKQQLTSTKQELATAQPEEAQSSQGSRRKGTGLTLVTAKVLYDEFAEQLGATQDELAATQQDVKDANDAATQAEQDAAAAKQDAATASNETDKAKAEASQAKAESQAAQSKAKAAAGCAKAYIRGVRRSVRGRQCTRSGRGRSQGPPERHGRLQGGVRGCVAVAAPLRRLRALAMLGRRDPENGGRHEQHDACAGRVI
jgi:hypothetical protein